MRKYIETNRNTVGELIAAFDEAYGTAEYLEDADGNR